MKRQQIGILIAWLAAAAAAPLAHGQCGPAGCLPQRAPWSAAPWDAAPESTPAADSTNVPHPTALADYHRAVVRVGREDLAHPGRSYSGTATLIARSDRQAVLLTAAHVLAMGGGRVWVDFGAGPARLAQLIGADERADLAAVTVADPPPLPAIDVAGSDALPRTGDAVEVVGYGGGALRHFRATVRGYTQKEETDRDQLVVAFRPISGDSGGPVLFRGQLAGVVWGGPSTDGRSGAYETHATCCRRIRQFLDRLGVHGQSSPAAPTAPGAAPPSAVPPNELPPVAAAPAEPSPSDTQQSAAMAARLKNLEAALGRLASQLRQREAAPAAAPSIAGWPGGGLSGLVPAIVGKALAALPAVAGLGLATGGLGIPAYLALVAGRAGLAWLRSRSRHRQTARPTTSAGKGGTAPAPPTFPSAAGQPGSSAATTEPDPLDERGDEFGSQLLRLHEAEGRNPLHDATLGRVFDQETQLLAAGSDQVAAGVMSALRSKVLARFNQIHPLAVSLSA